MKGTPRPAAEVVLGSSLPPLTGRGARVLLLDQVVPPVSEASPRWRSWEPQDAGADERRTGARDRRAEQRAWRRASICAEGPDGSALPGGSVGLAGDAELVLGCDHQLTPAGIGGLCRRIGELEVDVVGLQQGARWHAGPAAAAALSELSDPDAGRPATVVVAAEPGDSLCRAPSVIAVGRGDERGRLEGGPWDGPPGSEPELVMADEACSARLHGGDLGHLDGHAARVAVVAGLAALWVENLRRRGVSATPSLVRAALLAGARPGIPGGPRRIVGSRLPSGEGLMAQVLEADDDQRVRLRVAESGSVSIAVVTRPPSASPLWVSKPPRSSVTVTTGGETSSHSGPGWVVVDLELEEGTCIELEIDAGGQAVAMVGLGVEHRPLRRRAPRRASAEPVILGLSASHNGSACLMRGGRIEHAVQLERITRVKRDGQPFLHAREAADYVLRAAGLRARDVDVFAFNAQPLTPKSGLNLPSHDESFDLFDPFGERSVFVSHHLCHAFASFFSSPFGRATVLVVDGAGGSTVGPPDLVLRGPQLAEYLDAPVADQLLSHVVSVYLFDEHGFSLVDREHSGSFKVLTGTGSLGEAYATVSQYVFGNWQDGGKLMGLAPYGDAERCGPTLLERNPEGRLVFRSNWKNRFRRAMRRGDPLDHRDLAARVQRDLEDGLVDRVRTALRSTGCPRLAYAGGVALNGVANDRIRTECGVESMFVLPSSNDAGICIGAAAAARHLLTGRTRGTAPTHDFLGYSYGADDHRVAVASFGGTIASRRVELDHLVERLAAEQVVGWFDGPSEFGPRALGHRSLLASAASQSMWRYINRRIKFREDFRPFAPMVPEELASRYFELDEPSPYMLRVVRVRPEYRERLAAVTHVDGSARVQTVSRQILPEIHELLLRFGAKTGIPVLLNTSMNVRGEPIVETPSQAIELMLATHLDAVVFGGRCLVTPTEASEGIGLETVLELPPKTDLITTTARGSHRSRLVCRARGDATYPIEPWARAMLELVDGERSVEQLLHGARLGQPAQRARALELLSTLHTLRLLLVRGPAAELEPEAHARGPGPAEVDAPIAPEPGERPGLAAIVTAEDRAPLAEGSLRVRPVAQTLRRVWSLRHQLGITRVADQTPYDRLSIPVFGATRPDVHHSDITSNQGKGLTPEDSLVSCLMEAVERRAGWHRRSAPVVRTLAQLESEGASTVDPAQLGWGVPRTEPLDWVRGRSLRDGREVWVPAAEVYSPYVPPPGVRPLLAASTTGLCSGNTLAEAVVHGIHEVVERDAVSRYIDGQPGRLLDLGSLPPGPERELVASFVRAEIDIFVVDLSDLSPIPVFSVCVYDPEGVEPRIATAGQGAGASPRKALRRALLEAAQSRVVALQGSREDLLRHSGRWVEDEGERRALWEDSRAAAARGGMSTLPPEPSWPTSLAAALEQRLEQLARAGYPDVIHVDLTDPKIGLPVAGVVIPGMYDGDLGGPARRRRSA